MKRKPYPKYKPSGLEWLGDVPEHWETRRIKDVGSLRGGAGFPYEEQGVEDEELPFYKVGDLKASSDGRVMGKPEHTVSKETAKKLRAAIIPPDSVVYAKIGAALLLNRRRVTFAHCCIDNNMTAYLPDKRRVRTDWAFYWLSTLDFGEFMNPGAVPSFSEGDQSILPVLVPPPSEQRAITAFLDRETGRIDTLIAKKRELVERLKEKRTALISHTVTHGLPPDAAKKAGLPVNPPLRPSGVEWLGDIPEHWNTMSLKWHSRCHSGDGISTDDVSPDRTIERCIPVIGGNGVMGYCDRLNCNHQVLVIGRVGALCGNVHHIVSPAWITDNALVMQTDPATFVREYLAAVLRTRNLNELADKTAQPLITGTRIRSERVPVPPLPEQAAIAAYLDAETSKLDALISKLEETVERMQEYRTALITAAVTGKIDVRGNAIALRHV